MAVQVALRGALDPHCEDRVLDGTASWGKGSKGGLYMYSNPRTPGPQTLKKSRAVGLAGQVALLEAS